MELCRFSNENYCMYLSNFSHNGSSFLVLVPAKLVTHQFSYRFARVLANFCTSCLTREEVIWSGFFRFRVDGRTAIFAKQDGVDSWRKSPWSSGSSFEALWIKRFILFITFDLGSPQYAEWTFKKLQKSYTILNKVKGNAQDFQNIFCMKSLD